MAEAEYEDPSLFNNIKISLSLREIETQIEGIYDGHMHIIDINDEDMDDNTKLAKTIIEKLNIPKVIIFQDPRRYHIVEVEVKKIDSNFRPHHTKSNSGSRLKKVKKINQKASSVRENPVVNK